ncbi:hypothetical protein AVEN_137544-1 [Araneus ventricosus]|uniref:Uncharacterized protein n=1 Tax=Araneus ventricosus TaxID=182803 RepID=A0A4Y2FLF9_ARAVE|nr:hypothetical protein AVEN_137544-1 [Araneus ventricosus]
MISPLKGAISREQLVAHCRIGCSARGRGILKPGNWWRSFKIIAENIHLRDWRLRPLLAESSQWRHWLLARVACHYIQWILLADGQSSVEQQNNMLPPVALAGNNTGNIW